MAILAHFLYLAGSVFFMDHESRDEWFARLSAFEESAEGSPLARKILVRVGLVGFVTAGMLAPGLLQAIDATASVTGKRHDRKQVTTSLTYLKRRGLIALSKRKDGTKVIHLTSMGEEKLRRYFLDTVTSISKQKIWDKKWRVVIFDVPNKANRKRVLFREKMKELGFRQVQKSVWIYPYKCEDEIFFLAKTLRIDRYVDILVVKKFYDDEKYRALFFKKKHNKK